MRVEKVINVLFSKVIAFHFAKYKIKELKISSCFGENNTWVVSMKQKG